MSPQGQVTVLLTRWPQPSISKQVLKPRKLMSSLHDPAGLCYCSWPFLRLEIHFHVKVDDWIIWMFYLKPVKP